MQISFRHKLIFSYIAVVSISLGVIAFFLDRVLEDRSLREIESSLAIQGRLMVDNIPAEKIEAGDADHLGKLVLALGQRSGCRVTVIDTRGTVVADSGGSAADVTAMDNHINRPEVHDAIAGRVGINIRRSPTLDINMLYAALPITGGKGVSGVVRLALPLDSVKRTLWSIRKVVLLGFLFAVCLAVLLGSILASRTIEPINRMIHISRKFSEGDFGRRIIQVPRDEIGELARALNKMAQDIEDKIREVKIQNQRLEAIFNSMVEGVLVVNGSGRIVSINPTVERMFGIEKDKAEGRLLLDAIRNNDMGSIVSSALDSAKAVSAEIELVYPVKGTFQINATPVFDAGRISGCLAVIHDITQIRRLETVRSDFVANASHELKTPLTSIKGFVETLLEGAIDDSHNARDFLGIIRDHTERLDRLVRDLLVLSHLESSEIRLERSAFDLHKDVERIVMGFGAQLKKRGIKVNNRLAPGLTISADRDRIGQVMTNLIDNAVKFNKDAGEINIYNEEAHGAIRIVVEDTGSGIPQKDIGRIFERFYRVDKARSASLGGTGLGLSIVKHIVEMHGGTVGVDSNEGFHSRFWFTIPR